jgi:hypothetical protein
MYFLTAWFIYTNDFKDFTLQNGSVNLRAGGRQITRLQLSEGQGRLTLFFLLLLLLPVAGRKSTLSEGLILMAHETGLPAEPPDEDVREPGYGSIQNNSSQADFTFTCQVSIIARLYDVHMSTSVFHREA